MNRTIEDAITKRYHYDTHEQRSRHLALFLHTATMRAR
jgi:hypothetical protein